MNNKEFIATLAAKTGYTQDESQKDGESYC